MNKNLQILLACLFVVMIGLGITQPVLPFYVERLALGEGASRQAVAMHIGLITGVFALGQLLVVELARCEWIGRRENVLALGNSGTGKTHIGLALGLAACQQGIRVRFTTAAAPVHELIEARDEKRLLRYQKNLARQELLIVDELGFVLVSSAGPTD